MPLRWGLSRRPPGSPCRSRRTLPPRSRCSPCCRSRMRNGPKQCGGCLGAMSVSGRRPNEGWKGCDNEHCRNWFQQYVNRDWACPKTEKECLYYVGNDLGPRNRSAQDLQASEGAGQVQRPLIGTGTPSADQDGQPDGVCGMAEAGLASQSGETSRRQQIDCLQGLDAIQTGMADGNTARRIRERAATVVSA